MSTVPTENQSYYIAYYEHSNDSIDLDIAIFRKLVYRTPWWRFAKKRKLQQILEDLRTTKTLMCPTSDTLQEVK